MSDCPHRCEDIGGFVLGGGTHCVSWGVCELCEEHITLYAIDWWQIAFRLWDTGLAEPVSSDVSSLD